LAQALRRSEIVRAVIGELEPTRSVGVFRVDLGVVSAVSHIGELEKRLCAYTGEARAA
jgi:hypothetical protein